MDISLEYYKIFYYVGKIGSISGAAQVLCISQPAVSQAVKQLENKLGVTLFVRKQKGVVLTAEGEMLFSYVKQGYEYICMGEDKIRQMVDLDCGEVHIGASDMTLRYYLLNYLEDFHKKYPNIKVSVTNGPTPDTLGCLAEGRIDFGVVSGPITSNEDLIINEVREIEDIFIAGKSFAKYQEKIIKLTELEQMPIVCLEPNTSTRKYVDDFLFENDVHIEPEFEIATSDMIVQFAVKNLGVGCVVKDFAKEMIERGEIFELQLEKQIPKRHICVATNSKMPMSSAGKYLYDMLLHSR